MSWSTYIIDNSTYVVDNSGVVHSASARRVQLASSNYEVSTSSDVADDAARALAADVLSPGQVAQWNSGEPRRFCVRGSNGSMFEIHDRGDTNVLHLFSGSWHCVMLPDSATGECLPQWDLYVAQKLLIETDERLFWATAIPGRGLR